MTYADRLIYWATSVGCFFATIANVISVCRAEENVSFAVGISVFIFSLLGHALYVVFALVLGAKYHLRRWPLWFCFFHPIVAFMVFTWANSSLLFGKGSSGAIERG
jgi:hypothetical protein